MQQKLTKKSLIYFSLRLSSLAEDQQLYISIKFLVKVEEGKLL